MRHRTKFSTFYVFNFNRNSDNKRQHRVKLNEGIERNIDAKAKKKRETKKLSDYRNEWIKKKLYTSNKLSTTDDAISFLSMVDVHERVETTEGTNDKRNEIKKNVCIAWFSFYCFFFIETFLSRWNNLSFSSVVSFDLIHQSIDIESIEAKQKKKQCEKGWNNRNWHSSITSSQSYNLLIWRNQHIFLICKCVLSSAVRAKNVTPTKTKRKMVESIRTSNRIWSCVDSRPFFFSFLFACIAVPCGAEKGTRHANPASLLTIASTIEKGKNYF